MRQLISVQPQSTYQSSNSQLWFFIILRRHIGAYHGPNLVFDPMTVTCNITCVSFEVICLCHVIVLRGFLGCARENRNIIAHIHLPLPMALLHLGFYRLLGMIFFLILVLTLIIYLTRFFTSSALSSSTNLSIAPIKFSSLLDKSQIVLSIW